MAARVPILFFGITFAISWPCFIGVAMLAARGSSWLPVLLYTGIFAPAFVAITLTAWRDGSSGVTALLRPLFQWHAGMRWYVFAVSYMAAIKLTVAVLHRLITGAWPRFGTEPWYLIIGATILSTVIGGQAGEEIGWRGYALPRLADRLGFPVASLLLGVVWAAWHLPLFFMAGADKQGQSFVIYTIQVTALSVAMAWLYVHTRGSLLLMMLMHSAVNQTKDIVPSASPGAADVFTTHASLVAWLTVTLLWACAAWFLLDLRGLCRRRPLPV
jgi:membrane protease YdiL (CAAX protease family)